MWDITDYGKDEIIKTAKKSEEVKGLEFLPFQKVTHNNGYTTVNFVTNAGIKTVHVTPQDIEKGLPEHLKNKC
jgi:hypothetical protein